MRLTARVALNATIVLAILVAGSAAAQNREAPPGFRPQANPAPAPTGRGGCPQVPVNILSLSFSDSDTSCGATSTISVYNNAVCNAFDYPGPEKLYEVSLGAGNDILAILTPEIPADLGIFMVNNCSDGTSCVAFNDSIGGGAVSSIAPGTLTKQIYWLYVDSYYGSGAASCGNYTLDVTGTDPLRSAWAVGVWECLAAAASASEVHPCRPIHFNCRCTCSG